MVPCEGGKIVGSKTYFDIVSDQWDTIRQTFFSDSIREKMCESAQVKAGSTAVDVGAGTGFVTQELLNRRLRVIAVDQSQEMLDVLEHKFGSSGAITCIQADAYTLPLEGESVDYVMANMFLHHVENPDQAIFEMTRILKPGGKLVIADLDRHDYEFLRKEQYDVWLGFERSDIRKWFTEANLSNINIEDLNEQCCCDSCESCSSAAINIFITSAEKLSI
jgi:ubiquinone/menaquinone biosynthesis C-methylase UbiE